MNDKSQNQSLLDRMMYIPLVLLLLLHIDIMDNHPPIWRILHLLDTVFHKKMVDIDHCIHRCHNRINLLNILMDNFSYIDPSTDMIDIRIEDNHSNQFDNQDDN